MKKRGVYIDPMWAVFLLIGVAFGLLITMTGPEEAVEAVEPVVKVVEVPVKVEVPVEAVVEREPVFALAEPPVPETDEPEVDEREAELLALVIYQEAGGDKCSDRCRQMVGEVALNRVANERFPDDLESVLLQKGQYGRLSWTGIQWPGRAANPGEKHAVERAYRIAESLLDGSAERILPADTVWQAEFEQGTEVVEQLDGFWFCR